MFSRIPRRVPEHWSGSFRKISQRVGTYLNSEGSSIRMRIRRCSPRTAASSRQRLVRSIGPDDRFLPDSRSFSATLVVGAPSSFGCDVVVWPLHQCLITLSRNGGKVSSSLGHKYAFRRRPRPSPASAPEIHSRSVRSNRHNPGAVLSLSMQFYGLVGGESKANNARTT